MVVPANDVRVGGGRGAREGDVHREVIAGGLVPAGRKHGRGEL